VSILTRPRHACPSSLLATLPVLTFFFTGLADACVGKAQMSAAELADTLDGLAKRMRTCMPNVKEGTLVTVIAEVRPPRRRDGQPTYSHPHPQPDLPQSRLSSCVRRKSVFASPQCALPTRS
jgi:hypothetical protein